MSKGKTVNEKIKISFGKRKKGKSRKSYNRHDRTERNYRGQGV